MHCPRLVVARAPLSSRAPDVTSGNIPRRAFPAWGATTAAKILSLNSDLASSSAPYPEAHKPDQTSLSLALTHARVPCACLTRPCKRRRLVLLESTSGQRCQHSVRGTFLDCTLAKRCLGSCSLLAASSHRQSRTARLHRPRSREPQAGLSRPPSYPDHRACVLHVLPAGSTSFPCVSSADDEPPPAPAPLPPTPGQHCQPGPCFFAAAQAIPTADTGAGSVGTTNSTRPGIQPERA